MPVVTAGVHRAVRVRGVLECGLLGDGQRVHVGAQRHQRGAGGALQVRNHAGAGHAAPIANAERVQCLAHLRGRTRLVPGELGVSVQVAPERHDPLEQLVVDRSRHAFSPAAKVSERAVRLVT